MKTVRALVIILALIVFIGYSSADDFMERVGNQCDGNNNGGGTTNQYQ